MGWGMTDTKIASAGAEGNAPSRLEWEQPRLFRLAATKAESNVAHRDDGNCVGGFNGIHECKS